jgi:hypothetical protein
MYVSRKIDKSSRNNYCRDRVMINIYAISATVAVVIPHAVPMRRITMSSAVCLFLSTFFPLAHKHYDFREKSS